MYRTVIFGLLALSLLSGCNKKSSPESDTMATENDTLHSEPVIRPIGETLLPKAREKVAGWDAYKELDLFLENYYTASPQEALNLSKELATITKRAIDSLKIDRFKEPDVQIRLNVLYNAVLRLEDMATIPNISHREVLDETKQILDAFSALNAKINNLTRKEEIEKQLEELENKIGKDTVG